MFHNLSSGTNLKQIDLGITNGGPPGLGQIARGQFARSFFEGFIEDLFLLFIRSAVPRERSFKSFFFILVARDILLFSSIRAHRSFSGFPKISTMSTQTRHYNVRFIRTQRGMDIPVANDYLFVAKDKERRRHRCKTRTCNASILLHMSAGGTCFELPPLHNHPPHDELIKDMEGSRTIPRSHNSATYGFDTILPLLFATLLDLRPFGGYFLPDGSITQSPRPIIATAAISHRP